MEIHAALMAMWLYIALSYFLTNGTDTLPKKDACEFAPLAEYV
jgi:hypothetical protein